MKKIMESKFKNKSGFTLVEMLIVVAIIAILVAVSIPLVTISLDKAKQATDDANLRSAKAAAVIEWVGNGTDVNNKWYNIETGRFDDSGTACGKSSDNTDKAIKVTISGNDVSANWANP